MGEVEYSKGVQDSEPLDFADFVAGANGGLDNDAPRRCRWHKLRYRSRLILKKTREKVLQLDAEQ